MAGNVKEWCWNGSEGKRYILGGAWNEPVYMFTDPDAQSPFDRLPTYGLRLAKYLSEPPQSTLNAILLTRRDYCKEKPVPDQVFNTRASTTTTISQSMPKLSPSTTPMSTGRNKRLASAQPRGQSARERRPVNFAVEPRIRAAVLVSGGYLGARAWPGLSFPSRRPPS